MRSLVTHLQLALNGFIEPILGVELGEALAQRDGTPGKPVYLFGNVIGDAVIADTSALKHAGTPGSNFLPRKLQNHNLSCNKELDHAVIRSPAMYQQLKTLSYPRHFITAEDVPIFLADLLTSGSYARDARAKPAVGRSPCFHPASFLDR